jgi:hypothetical protein
MVTLADAKENQRFLQLPKIPVEDIRWLWINHWVDGPIEGMVKYQDKETLALMVEEAKAAEQQGFYRRYALIELDEAELTNEHYWHRLFVEKVGDHWTFDEALLSKIEEGLRSPETHDEFYNAYRQRIQPDYSNNPVIGWLEVV